MNRCSLFLACILFTGVAGAQALVNMDFETDAVADSMPAHWIVQEDGFSCAVDSSVVHSGGFSARFTGELADVEGYLSQTIPINCAGYEVTLSGWYRSDSGLVSSYFGAYLVAYDSDEDLILFDYLEFEEFGEDTLWHQFEASIPLRQQCESIEFGVYLREPGTVWIDDLQLLVDGAPLDSAPERVIPAAELDHEFDSGSGIEFGELSPFQMESLVQLGKVWGFLKYHHPAPCSGSVNWDYELFRVLPFVLAASDGPAREAALMRLLPDVEPVEARNVPMQPSESIKMEGDFSWIDGTVIGHSLAYLLESVYHGRYMGERYYINMSDFPEFVEEDYSSMVFPDGGYRLLALYRYWAMIEYYFPYRYVTNNPWYEQMAISLPLFVQASDALEYQLAVKSLIASVGDTHAGLWREPDALKEYIGIYHAPVVLSYVEDSWVITGFMHESAVASPLEYGDVILSMDGVPLSARVEEMLPYANGSNQMATMEIIGRSVLRGSTESALIEIARGEQQFELSMPRVLGEELDYAMASVPAVGDESYSVLPEGFGYLDMASLQQTEVPLMKEAFQPLPGIVLDLRGYPSDFVLYDVANFLIPDSAVFCEITFFDYNNPGTFYFEESMYAGGGDSTAYSGPVALLVDEGSISSSEFHAMAWRLAPNSMVFGHATNGADGNVVRLSLPGGISTMYSGIGIYNPDFSETQRVGILPDVEVTPTVAGLQAGRDEVLEAAVEWLQTQ